MTSATAPLVAVDIGNSAAKWSLVGPAGAAAALHRAPLCNRDWPAQVTAAVQTEVARQVPGRPEGTARAVRWRIAAVNAPACQQMVAHLQALATSAGVHVVTRRDLPLAVRVPQPDRVGIDRLLAIWRASEIYPRRPLVVVDAGSAITIDSAAGEGDFLGGVILPGLGLQFDSLARGTDALPALRPSDFADLSAADLPVPAPDTITAIRSGILLGAAAAIDGLIARSLDAAARGGSAASPQVVLTGGDALRLSPWIAHRHVRCERLVIEAIASLPQ